MGRENMIVNTASRPSRRTLFRRTKNRSREPHASEAISLELNSPIIAVGMLVRFI